MRASLFLRPTFFALILLSTVLCMDDEADEIYRSVNEGFTSQDQEFLMDLFAKDDQEFLMDLFAKDDQDSSHFDGNNAIEPKVKDPQKRYDKPLTELDAEIDKLGKES